MNVLKWVFLMTLVLGQGAYAQVQKCMDLVPAKRDYIVSGQLLRDVIDCIEKETPKPVVPDTYLFGIHYDEQTYVLPLMGQNTIVIRQLNLFEQNYQYEITFFNNQGKILKSLSVPFYNKKEEKINLSKQKVKSASYAIVKIVLKDKQNPPMAMVFAT